MMIGSRLRELREQRSLSQGDITEMIGLPRSYISRIENGHAVPSLETLQRMSAALDVPLYRLFYLGEVIPNGHQPRLSLEELADDSGPSGVEARFLIEMRDLTKTLRRPERVFLLNLAGRLATRKSAPQISDLQSSRRRKREGASQKAAVSSR
jgi:transcriptional regulator with XRE-family HTH domain